MSIKEKSDTFTQKLYDTYNHDIRKIVCVITGLTSLLCKISLQFCCEFINKNRSNIFFIQNIAKWIKFPISTFYIIYSTFILCNPIKHYENNNKKKEELIKIIGKSASLASGAIEILAMLKVFHFISGNNNDISIMNHIHLISTILFIFIAEPINYYYTYKKYQKAHAKYQNKEDNEFIKFESEFIRRRKSFFINTLTLSLGLLNFILKKIEIATTPINLGSCIYNFNLSVTVSIIYSAVFLAIHLDKLFFNQPINNNPSTDLDINHIQSINNKNFLYNPS
ncbi:MAG: hypothetical protein LJI21_00335 [Wolbachia endosymbiont of Menacanthus eurysternus]|nr:MAG: hypothetical protein LJI21_00335 [Wolbachia endosymbiont of Menacanthus eurysternus]